MTDTSEPPLRFQQGLARADCARPWVRLPQHIRPRTGMRRVATPGTAASAWPCPRAHCPPTSSPAEIKRRTNVVGIFPNDAAIARLAGAMMLVQNDEWSLNRRYMQLEGLQTVSDTVPTRLSAVAR